MVRSETQPGLDVSATLDLTDYARRTASSFYYPVGTCAIKTGNRAVFGPDPKVHRVDYLWIADASVMPKIPFGNRNATSLMIGEKAAKLIKSRLRVAAHVAA